MLLNSDFDYPVYNLGVSGDNTEDLLKRFETECKARLSEEKSVIIIFAIGINDSQFLHNENRLRIPPEKFKENIKKLINLSKKFTTKIIFVGLTPVDETKTIPLPWNTNKSYRNENVEKYNKIIRLICKKSNIYFIEIFERWVKINYKDLLEDGLHPNSKGHEKIFETVKSFLFEKKII